LPKLIISSTGHKSGKLGIYMFAQVRQPHASKLGSIFQMLCNAN
jgi:hypothetical protein